MVRAAGANVVTSGELVSRFFAVWTPAQTKAHERAAEIIAQVARDAFQRAAERTRSGKPITEYELQEWIKEQFASHELFTDHGPNVSTQKNAANPHYEPTAESSATIRDGELLLIDLWATEQGGIYADQTWVASLGTPSDKAVKVFEAVRDARDAALDLITTRVAAGEPVRGAEADDAARRVIESRGYGQYFVHRTGHSIDARELHGSGPHLDNLESREERLLVPGVGFSVEPGVYIPGELGVRLEVNVYLEQGRAVVTPNEIQRELWIY
jgi:Xaa-Pro aminopeptidase